jgi:hypothetical protein
MLPRFGNFGEAYDKEKEKENQKEKENENGNEFVNKNYRY